MTLQLFELQLGNIELLGIGKQRNYLLEKAIRNETLKLKTFAYFTTMAGDPNFCTAHIDFDDHGRGLSPSENVKKRMTIIAASAVSILCYEDSNNVASAFREHSDLELARKHDLVSAIWSLNEPPDIPRVASERRSHGSTPIMAWSKRSQIVFIGFRGTNATQDVLTDLDIRQAPGVNLGTRFHRGFLNSALPYGPLVSELSRKFRVVICGHSLGGALATIVGYHVLVDSLMPNLPVCDTWEEAGSQGISVVTFGAPPMMVAEATGTTSVPRRRIAKLFHHIFNADDPVPFMVNDTIAMLKDRLHLVGELAQIAIPAAQINMQMEQLISDEKKPQFFLETADAIQKELKVQDCFGRFTRLKLDEMKHVLLGEVARTTTFEAIRVALIIALVRQESKALALRRGNPTAFQGSCQEASVLTTEATQIAECMDWIVANASPHLVVTNLSGAFKMIQEIWAEKPSTGEESQSVDRDYLPSQVERYIPEGCTGRLRDLVLEMLVAINNSCTLDQCTEKDWQKSGVRRMIDAHPRVPTITATLCQSGKDLYNRSSDSQQRIHDAIRHSDEVLSAMRFCHLLVLTQLDAPSDWIMAFEDDKMWLLASLSHIPGLFATIGGLSIQLGIQFAAGVGLIMLPLIGVVVAATYTAQAWLNGRRKRELGFQLNLVKSLETLGLPTSRFDCITESIISEYIRSKGITEDMLKAALVQGLASAPKTPALPRLKIKEFWPRWLFMVAKMGQVRNVIKRRLYVGVEGTTEAGKSELLTVLLAAPETAFSSGANIDSRTMDIQMYETENLSAAYFDCPGCDDQASQIQEMAALVRDALDVIIFVIPYSEMRSSRTETFLREVGNFLATRTDPRPVRVLLSKVDNLTFRKHQILQFELTVSQAKRDAIRLICNHSSLTSDSPIPSQRAVSHLGDSHVVLSTETLEDIVQPYSTHSHMSSVSLRALSDCDRKDDRMISDTNKFQQLYQMARDGQMWDIESLREWLRNLCPSSVPFSEGRVAPS
ncbi:hypothetical protein N7493_009434 [Penicillium malachiteum]|uniref:Fungal lipase-like domain-containing protein n=1 Tax=Penicillium malachiteum TaxID=1324776 RepID=A0AAD6HE57_9EURO|nr:hypothetical protein N7493_009434 [Penicillium malachiteum]